MYNFKFCFVGLRWDSNSVVVVSFCAFIVFNIKIHFFALMIVSEGGKFFSPSSPQDVILFKLFSSFLCIQSSEVFFVFVLMGTYWEQEGVWLTICSHHHRQKRSCTKYLINSIFQKKIFFKTRLFFLQNNTCQYPNIIFPEARINFSILLLCSLNFDPNFILLYHLLQAASRAAAMAA